LDEGAKVRREEGLRARGERRGERREERGERREERGSGSVNKRERKKRG
jgi:hypothetical protein